MIKRSELRQDIVSGDWILMAPGRSKRPHVPKYGTTRVRGPVSTCPFENPARTNRVILTYEGKKGWELLVVENLYPAVFERNQCGAERSRGPYRTVEGVGSHNVVITRDHNKNFAHLAPREAIQVFAAFRDRYLQLLENPCIAYVSMFHNWGPAAGASIYHPHYQIIAIPVIPPDVEHSIRGSKRYYEKHHTCVHCTMLEFERRAKKRIIYENEGAIVVAPYVSREPYEVRVFPKRHAPHFENSLEGDLASVADALQVVLRRTEKALGDPDYNFFIHTAPISKREKHAHYHWHIEVVPHSNISAGFELGTGIEINVVDPDDAAKALRKR